MIQNRIIDVHRDETQRFMKYHRSIQYEPGDRVWIKVQDRDREKLDPLWMGPCEIIRHVHGGRYTVSTPYGEDDHHMDSFKPYMPGLRGEKLPFHYYRPHDVPEEDNWTVEKILKHRRKDGKLQWLVQWKGYSKPTWENMEQFIGYAQKDWMEYNRKCRLEVPFH